LKQRKIKVLVKSWDLGKLDKRKRTLFRGLSTQIKDEPCPSTDLILNGLTPEKGVQLGLGVCQVDFHPFEPLVFRWETLGYNYALHY
jgi:hypothetical protein